MEQSLLFSSQPKWTLKDGGRSPPRGGFHATAENQQILPPDEMELQMAAEAGPIRDTHQPLVFASPFDLRLNVV